MKQKYYPVPEHLYRDRYHFRFHLIFFESIDDQPFRPIQPFNFFYLRFNQHVLTLTYDNLMTIWSELNQAGYPMGIRDRHFYRLEREGDSLRFVKVVERSVVKLEVTSTVFSDPATTQFISLKKAMRLAGVDKLPKGQQRQGLKYQGKSFYNPKHTRQKSLGRYHDRIKEAYTDEELETLIPPKDHHYRCDYFDGYEEPYSYSRGRSNGWKDNTKCKHQWQKNLKYKKRDL